MPHQLFHVIYALTLVSARADLVGSGLVMRIIGRSKGQCYLGAEQKPNKQKKKRKKSYKVQSTSRKTRSGRVKEEEYGWSFRPFRLWLDPL